jgi:hypothetical protein
LMKRAALLLAEAATTLDWVFRDDRHAQPYHIW